MQHLICFRISFYRTLAYSRYKIWAATLLVSFFVQFPRKLVYGSNIRICSNQPACCGYTSNGRHWRMIYIRHFIDELTLYFSLVISEVVRFSCARKLRTDNIVSASCCLQWKESTVWNRHRPFERRQTNTKVLAGSCGLFLGMSTTMIKEKAVLDIEPIVNVGIRTAVLVLLCCQNAGHALLTRYSQGKNGSSTSP